MSALENPPAFPFEPTGHKGMMLRDWYAGLAMQAAFAGVGAQQLADRDGRYDGTNWAEIVALNAYEMADAMLTARQHGDAA